MSTKLLYTEVPASSTMDVLQLPPPMQRGYAANNWFENIPPLMTDGRCVASYQPDAALNNYLLKEIGIHSNWEYRKYMQSHGKDIMKYNCMSMANDTGYYRKYGETDVKTMPYTHTSMQDRTVPYGGNSDSDLKTIYLSREELNSRKVISEPMDQSAFYGR